MFVDGGYRLAPKRSFLFHVVFHLNQKPKSYKFASSKQNELSMLVKNVTLPSFTPKVETKNRYNKKVNIQTAIDYNPVTINFWDDRSDVVRDLWTDYYKYYYNDTKHSGFNYQDSVYSSFPNSSRWGLDRYSDNESRTPFMNKIEIFSLNQKKFSSYTLINPIITGFNHGQHDYTDNGGLEHQMTINYESVLYGTGITNNYNVRGFGELHYDKHPSPLSIAGGGTNSIFGPGGFLQSGSEILGDLQNGNIFGAAFKSINVYQNLRDTNLKSALKTEGRVIVRDIIRNGTAAQLSDFTFPQLSSVAGSVNNTINSTAKQIGGAITKIGSIFD